VRQRIAAAEAANQAKDRFLAMLSHELRTPLNPILLWTQATLEDGQLYPSLRDGVRMVRRNIELEASLIDDLLDVARITGGKLNCIYSFRTLLCFFGMPWKWLKPSWRRNN
jgi:signal transduction histidine kinase